MKEKENQTPRKEPPRYSDLAHRRSKDSPANKTSKKISQKSLTGVFISPFEDVIAEISEESIDFSSISAISDNVETAEAFVVSSRPSLSASSEAFTPCSKMSTVNIDEQIDFPKAGSAEVEIIANLLNQARLQTLNSIDMDDKSKKVLDALIEFTINEFYTMPRGTDMIPEIVSRNAYVGFLALVLPVVAVSLFSFYLFCYSYSTSSVAGSSTGLPPT